MRKRLRLAKKHVGLYIPPPVIAKHMEELKGYETAMATIRLPLDKKLPSTLIRKLIKSRLKMNEKKPAMHHCITGKIIVIAPIKLSLLGILSNKHSPFLRS